MDGATEHVRALARRVTAVALELGPLRGALLAGSGARGDADFFSDVDLLLYVDEPPPHDRLESRFRLPAAEAADELGKLVVETRELVGRELPELELPLRRPPGTRAQAWSV